MLEIAHLEQKIKHVEDRVEKVQSDVADILVAVVGGKISPGGMKADLEAAQREIVYLKESTKLENDKLRAELEAVKQMQKSDRNYIIGVAAGGAFVVSVAWSLITLFFKK